MEIFIGITIGVYMIIGIAYINALPNFGYKGEWAMNILIATIWPYILLARFIQHRVFLAKQKRLKAFREAQK